MKELRKDILGNTPEVGDIIVFNPPKYKGLVKGKCIGFSNAGLPKVSNFKGGGWSLQYELETKGYYTPKTDFVCIKNFKIKVNEI